MFGLIGALIGWLSYHVGLRTDAADATSSLHAKVKDVKDTVSTRAAAADIIPRRSWAKTVITVNQTTNTSLLSLSGPGKILLIKMVTGASSSNYLTPVVDGVSQATINVAASITAHIGPLLVNDGSTHIRSDIEFKTSFELQGYVSSGTNPYTLSVAYER